MIRDIAKTVRGRFSVFTLTLVAFLTLAFGPSLEGLSMRGQYALAVVVFAGILWVSGTLPLAVTALSIPVLLTAYGVYGDIDPALTDFADHLIFLFIVGFMLANAPQKYNIDRHIVLWLMAVMGSLPWRLILTIMLATAFLSIWISNTATMAMMTPIALGVPAQVPSHEGVYKTDTAEDSLSDMQITTFLGTTYAAGVGGVGTLIGTLLNAVVATQLNALLDYDIGFAEWLLVGFLIVAITLPIVWYLLMFRFYPPEVDDIEGARGQAHGYLADKGAPSTRGRRVAYIFTVTARLWMLGDLNLTSKGVLSDQMFSTLFGTARGTTLLGVEDHQDPPYYVIVGMVSIPALALTDAVGWDELVDIDWGTILLFGGGISLADTFTSTDATQQLAEAVFGSLTSAPIALVVDAIVLLVIFLTEMTSNTTAAAIIVPVLIGIRSVSAAILRPTEVSAAVFLAVSRTIAASFTFALPAATPPSAIVFGSGHVKQSRMIRAGAVLSVVTAGVLAILI